MLRLNQLAAQFRRTTRSPSLALYYSATNNCPRTMSTMRALEIQKQGGLEVIEVRDIAKPTPGLNQILVRNEYAGVNMIDTYHYGGLYPLKTPIVIGQEAAGTIESVGGNVSHLKAGDKICSYGPGGYAQYQALDSDKVYKLPQGVDTKTAAASYLQGLTALTLVREAYPVQKGDYVLVTAAAGGVGLLLCQIASALGAHVIGTVSTEEKAKLAKANGAEHALLYSKDNLDELVQQVHQITGGQGCQGIYDGVGKDTWEADFQMVARKGTIVTFGNASGPVPEFTPLKLSPKNVKVCRPTLFGYLATVEERQTYSKELFSMIQSGALKIHIHNVYDFSQHDLVKAFSDIKSRVTTGKLVVNLQQ